MKTLFGALAGGIDAAQSEVLAMLNSGEVGK
jgi:hypothetical protein